MKCSSGPWKRHSPAVQDSLAALCTVVETPSDLLRTLTEGTSGVVGTAFLRTLVRQRETIRLFAARAAAELERRHAEQELRAREAEVAASGARMKASTMLDATRSEMRAIGEELRDMARGLAPAGLQQDGLAGALPFRRSGHRHRRGRGVRRGERGRVARRTVRSTTARATSRPCCSASRAGA
jgi:hypothetical protein